MLLKPGLNSSEQILVFSACDTLENLPYARSFFCLGNGCFDAFRTVIFGSNSTSNCWTQVEVFLAVWYVAPDVQKCHLERGSGPGRNWQILTIRGSSLAGTELGRIGTQFGTVDRDNIFGNFPTLSLTSLPGRAALA